MRELLCDSGPLIASFDRADRHHASCVRLLSEWPGQLVIPEPVLGETCNFLRNHVRNGPALELQFLAAVTEGGESFAVVGPDDQERRRAPNWSGNSCPHRSATLTPPSWLFAERHKIADIATVDFKFIGMGSRVCNIKPIRWVLQEGS